jgi:outer membrane receptor protein involved in Fe transport
MNLVNRGRSWGVFVFSLASALLLATAVSLVFATPAFAQGTKGILRGEVLDPSGAVVANAQVTARNQQTGVTVEGTTTSAGTYYFPSVLPGSYTVTVEASGFKKYVKTDVPVLANQENVADGKLELGVATQTVEVNAEAVAVQTTSSQITNDYDFKDVGGLPTGSGTLNGNPLNLAILSPGVVAQPGGVTGIGGSVGGARPRENNFVVDGVDDNNLGVTGPNSTVIPDAVGEFVLLTNQFSAEYGRSSGGQFLLVTKTGTNNWHGSGEWYAQNRNFDALDNLTKAAVLGKTIPEQPAFDNNRFGGTFGGPFIKDKLFFFGAYEYTTLHGSGTPTAFTAATAGGLATLQSLAVNSSVANILKNFPVAPAATSSITVNGTTTIPIGNITIISPIFQREHDVQFNTDYTRGKHQFGTRFTFNQEKFINPVNSTQAVFNQNQLVRNRKIALTDAWTISSHVVNDLRLQYSYFGEAFANPCSVCPGDVTLPDLSGGVTIGPSDNQNQKQNTYQVKDNVSWSRGKHTFKFGGEYTHYIYPQFFLPRSNGDYWYNTTTEFINDRIPGQVGRTLRNAGTGSFLGTQSLFAIFAQDDFKLSPRLTLNLGVRYEYWTNPIGGETQALNAISNVPGVITFGKPKTDKNNVGPRIGLAWDPRGDGKTAVRAGFGISYGWKFQNFQSITLPPQLQSELNEPSACTLTPTPTWCVATATTPAGATPGHNFLAGGGLPQTYIPPAGQKGARRLTTSFIDDTVLPKILNWTLSVEHEVYRNATVEVRYLGTRGIELPVQYRRNHISAFDAGIVPLPTFFRASDVPATWTASTPTDTPFNGFNSNIYANFPCTTGPGICGFRGNVTADPPFGFSTYHGGSVNFKQRARYGLTLNANYTYSHAEDNSTNEFFTSLLNPRRAQDTTRLSQDWSSSDLDVRHHFALSVAYEVPKTRMENRYLKAVLNGYVLTSTYLAQTGQPVTLQSGNAGLDSNGNGDTAGDRASLNPFGTLPRTGSDIFAVCEFSGGRTGLSNSGLVTDKNGNPIPSQSFQPLGLVTGAGGACFDPIDPTGGTVVPAIGYTPVNTSAKFILTGPGARANLSRNSWTTPGFGVWNFGIGKRTSFGESRTLEVRADVYNVLNHPSFTLSNGNILSTTGVSVATSTPGYALPSDVNFLNAPGLFSGGNRSITLVAKFVF